MHPEYELLLELANPAPSPDNYATREQLTNQITDWQPFLSLCRCHGLLAIISKAIRRQPQLFPESLLKEIRALALQNAARNLRLTANLLQILKLFQDHSLTLLPFKGPLLAQQIYGDISQRVFGDLDILISAKDAEQAIKLLEANGFQAELPDILSKLDTFKRQEDNLSLFNPKDNCLVELHWDMAGCYLASPLTLEKLQETIQDITLAGRATKTLSGEDLLLYLCIHGAKHHWERIEWILTVAKLAQDTKAPDWATIWDKACLWQCKRMLLLGLQLSRDLFQVSLPSFMTEKMSNDPVISLLAERTKALLFPKDGMSMPVAPEIRFSFFHLLVRDTLADRFRYALRLLFRPTIKEWQTWPLPSGLTFLYYLYRPLRLGWEWGMKKRSEE